MILSHSQSCDVTSLSVQSSHLKCSLPFGQGHELPALLGLLLPPSFSIRGPAALFSPPVTLLTITVYSSFPFLQNAHSGWFILPL